MIQTKTSPKYVKNNSGFKQTVLGDNQTIKLDGSDTNGQILLIEQFDNPGIGIPMHIHENEDEIFKVLEGKLKVIVENETHILGPGDLVFCPRGVPHSWEVIGEGKCKTILTILPSGLEKMLKELSFLDAEKFNFTEVEEIANKYDIKFV